MSKRPMVACRTCLRMNQTYVGIFEHYECNKLLSELLTECGAVKVERHDGLPIYMCNNCVEKLISAWNFRLMAIHSDWKFRNNKDVTVSFLFQNNENIQIVVCEDVNVKQEELMIKLEDSDQGFANKEISDNKLDEQEPNLLVVEYVDCNNSVLEESQSSQQNGEDLNVEVFDVDGSNSKSENIDKEHEGQEINNGQLDNIVEEKAETTDGCKVDENCINGVIGYDENGVPMTRNGCKLTWRERQQVPVFCKPCNRSFPWKYYIVHKRSHVGDIRFKCDVCSRAFVAMYQLKAHKEIHTEERLYPCDICGKRFKRKSNVRIHKQIHNEDRPHKCHLCGMAFKQSHALRAHIQRHTKNTQYMCEVCGKSFIDASSFSTHKKMHVGVKKHTCSTCGKKFHAPSKLKEHENRIHMDYRPYVCSHCGKRFKMSSTLKKHILIHTGEKPYSCNICGKRFRHRECLPGHIRMHTGETPFCCDKCPAKFKHLHLLRKHAKVHNS
ncbi:hypothetical protein Trydic_g2723 [Trypoxylus dichotomus]